MSKAKVVFLKCEQDSQEVGSTDEHMVSRIFFTAEIGGATYEGLYVDIKQTVGSSFETGPIEVSSIKGSKYRGPWNYDAFRAGVESYYRSLVGSGGSAIRISGSAANVRMRNNRLVRRHEITFDVSGTDGAW